MALNFSWNNLSVDSEVISQGVLLFAKGDRLNYSPEYTMGASTQYSMEFGVASKEACPPPPTIRRNRTRVPLLAPTYSMSRLAIRF